MHDAIIIGGGLAGSAAAQHLARCGHRVLLLEAERYPVHKMCGEFLSPEAQGLFERLGVAADIRALGAVPIRRVAISSPDGACWRAELPGEAIGISRWALDPLLFDAALAAGAEGAQGAVVKGVESAGSEFRVIYATEGQTREANARIVLGAFGRHSRLDKAFDREAGEPGPGFVAFKMHYTGADLADWVELHAFDGGYCGMSHVEDGRVNACLIARAEALRTAGRSYDAMRDSLMRTNPMLAARFDQMTPAMDKPISIARITFRTKALFSHDVLMLGDSAAMIAPLCGDGMSMALRSAEIAAPLVDVFLRERLSVEALRDRYTQSWRREFSGRLRLGRMLQNALFRPRLARLGLVALNRFPALGTRLIRATRDVGAESSRSV